MRIHPVQQVIHNPTQLSGTSEVEKEDESEQTIFLKKLVEFHFDGHDDFGLELLKNEVEMYEWKAEKDVLSDCMIVADTKEMSREELEKFADRMRIDRNSFLYRGEDEWKKLEDRVIELETELYFCNRNKRIGEVVDERT